MRFTDQTLVYRNANVAASEVGGGEKVLLSLTEPTCFGMNPVGARIWDLLAKPITVGSLCDAIVAEYGIAPSECRVDIEAFLESLLSVNLLQYRQLDRSCVARRITNQLPT